jgi:hypothetical protein
MALFASSAASTYLSSLMKALARASKVLEDGSRPKACESGKRVKLARLPGHAWPLSETGAYISVVANGGLILLLHKAAISLRDSSGSHPRYVVLPGAMGRYRTPRFVALAKFKQQNTGHEKRPYTI